MSTVHRFAPDFSTPKTVVFGGAFDRGDIGTNKFRHLPWYAGGTDVAAMSSTQIRDGLRRQRREVLAWVPPPIHKSVLETFWKPIPV